MFIVFELFFTSLQIKVSHLAHCIFHTLLQDTGVYDITKDIQTESQESHWRVTAILILPPEDTASPTSLVYSLFYPCIFVFVFIFQKCLTYWTIQQIFSITKSQQMVQLVLNEQDNQQEMDLNCSDRRISLLPWTRGTKIVFLFNQILDRLLMPSLTRHCLRVLPLTCLAQLVPASRQASSDRIPWLWLITSTSHRIPQPHLESRSLFQVSSAKVPDFWHSPFIIFHTVTPHTAHWLWILSCLCCIRSWAPIPLPCCSGLDAYQSSPE